jgi:hypothetical protein
MSVGMNAEGHHATGAHAASGQSLPSIPGLPSVVKSDPQTYIDRLLSENGMGESVPKEDFFSPTDGSSHHKEEKKNLTNTLLKWGVGILAAAVLWRVAINRKAGNLLSSMGAKLQHRKPTQ